MTEYPRILLPSAVSPEMRELITDLMHRLLTGSHPALEALREQFERAELARLTLTGAGFYAYFNVPSDARRVEPPHIIGGDVPMTVDGLEHGAGCLLSVTDGRIDFLEGYTFGEEWPERPLVRSLGTTTPMETRAPAT